MERICINWVWCMWMLQFWTFNRCLPAMDVRRRSNSNDKVQIPLETRNTRLTTPSKKGEQILCSLPFHVFINPQTVSRTKPQKSVFFFKVPLPRTQKSFALQRGTKRQSGFPTACGTERHNTQQERSFFEKIQRKAKCSVWRTTCETHNRQETFIFNGNLIRHTAWKYLEESSKFFMMFVGIWCFTEEFYFVFVRTKPPLISPHGGICFQSSSVLRKECLFQTHSSQASRSPTVLHTCKFGSALTVQQPIYRKFIPSAAQFGSRTPTWILPSRAQTTWRPIFKRATPVCQVCLADLFTQETLKLRSSLLDLCALFQALDSFCRGMLFQCRRCSRFSRTLSSVSIAEVLQFNFFPQFNHSLMPSPIKRTNEWGKHHCSFSRC